MIKQKMILALGLAAALSTFVGCASAPAKAPAGPSLPPVELADAPAAPEQHDELGAGLAWIVEEAMPLAREPGAPSTYGVPLRLDPVLPPAGPAPRPAVPDPIEQISLRR